MIKFIIEYDGMETGITNDLLKGGIPKENIVLAFYPPEVRQETELAIS